MKTQKVSEVFKVGQHNIGYVESSFLQEFGNDDVEEGNSLPFQTLKRNMYDSEIISELGIQECTLGDVLATLEKATGEMKDGYANIFYIKGHGSRVVSVRWSGGEWRVRGWDRGGTGWLEDYRVFSPATGTQDLSSKNLGTMTLESAIKICKEAGLKVVKITEEEL